MPGDYKRIENMNRDELHDLIASLNKEIQDSVHSGTRCFHRAMEADRKKEKAQNRLAELEDFPTVGSKPQTFPPDLS